MKIKINELKDFRCQYGMITKSFHFVSVGSQSCNECQYHGPGDRNEFECTYEDENF